MAPLPLNQQGYIHVIQIPLEPGRLPRAFICYIRPRRIDDNNSVDIIDDKILEAIRTKFPTATRSTNHAIYEEQVEASTAMFHNWHPFTITIALLPPLDFETQAVTEIPNIPLSIYTQVPVDRLSLDIVNHPDDPQFDNWIYQLMPYHQLMDMIYPIEIDNNSLNCINTLPLVIDIRTLWQNVHA